VRRGEPRASRGEWRPLLVVEGGKAVAKEHGVQLRDGDGARRRDLDPDRHSVRIKVHVDAVLRVEGSRDARTALARQVKVRRERACPCER